MQQQLGLGALRLPSSLGELGASPLFSAAAAAAQEGPPDAAQIAAVLQQARRQPVTSLDWGLLLQALTSGLQGSQPAQLVTVLSWAADSAREQLEAAAAAGERPSGGSGGAAPAAASDVGNPRLRQALQNTLKLSLLFLCSLARGEAAGSRDAQHPAPTGGKRGGKKAKASAGAGEAAAEALTQLRVRRDALLAAGSIEDALHDNRTLLPAVSDLRAAGRLVRSAAMHCLVHPLPPGAAGGDRTAKELAEACFQAAAGILARTFVTAEERKAHAAAAQTLQDLLGVVAEPKQQAQVAQVLAGAARLVGSVMQQSRQAGAAIVARLTDRIQQAAAAASRAGKDAGAAALATQEQDACLHFAVLLAGTSGGGSLQAALLLRLPQLLPLVRTPSSSTRRLMLDLCSALLPSVAQLPFSPAPVAPQLAAVPPAGRAEPAADAAATAVAPATPPADPRRAYRAALLAAIESRLEDRDATLRAKALGCLEKHASLVAACLSAAAAEGSSASGGTGSSGSTDSGSALLQRLRGRLCDKSPSVRKKAVALLATLLQPAAGLSRPAAAALTGAVLPLAAQLLGVRPDSALHLGEETLKVLSQAVLRMAAASSSAAGVPHLLLLAAGATEPTARAQLLSSVLDLLLPPSAGPPSAQLLLQNLAAAVRQCSAQKVDQLRQAVQQAVGSGNGGGAMTAVVCSAVRACYQQLHSLCGAHGSAHQAMAGNDCEQAALLAADSSSSSAAQAEELRSAATALFVLGPLSSPSQADALASLAEARLLLNGLQHVAKMSIGQHSAAASRLLACTTLAWQLLAPACFPPGGSGSQPSDDSEPSAAASAALSLAHATLPALQALLLHAGCTPSLRQDALSVLFALPPTAQAPLRLLRSLTASAAAAAAAVAEDSAEMAAGDPAPVRLAHLQLQLDEDGELPLAGPANSSAAAEDAAKSAGDGSGSAAAEDTSARQQQAQQSALVALLDLLGGLASTYEQQKAAFLQQLVAGAAQREQAQQAQQAAGQTSHFGRPLRPASEWWVGTGQPGGGSTEQAAAAQEGGGAADDYMRAEHLAAEHEAAAQRYLESLLEAADTAPACYLPLLERLAGQVAEGEREGALCLPAAVQAAALRALGRLALLSESLSQRAVALAEAALGGGSSSGGNGGGGGGATEVQKAAVTLLADAIEAFPNRYSSRLLLIGRLMAPDAQPAAGEEEAASGPAESSGAGGAGSASEPTASQQMEQAEESGEGPAQQAQQARYASGPTAAASRPAATTALSSEQREQLARAAAAAYCRLLLRNKLKLQGMLGPLGSALAAASAPVAALVQHALRQMLGAAAPKERARLCMALFHQTPPSSRVALAQALVDPARGLLPAAELRGDVLVSQALQALLAAVQASGSTPSGRADGGASLAAAATLLCAMQPSAKVLAALHTQLQAGGSSSGSGGTLMTKLPAAARQALQAFVNSHVPAAAGREEGEQGGDGEAAEGGGAGGGKRKRKAGGSKGASSAMQQQLLALLSSGGGGRSAAHAWRPPRPAATATATGAASTAAGTSAAAPTTSTRSGSRPASSSREPASSARPTRSGSVRRRSVRSRVLEDESDSEASS